MYNIKKYITLVFGLLTFFLIFSSSPSVEGAEINDNLQPLEIPETMEATLISDSGETVTVVGELLESPPKYSLFSFTNNESVSELESNEATYEYSLYSTGTNSLTTIRTDSARAVRVTLTIDYTETTSGLKKAKLDQVRGSYTRIDPTVRLSDARLIYGTVGLTRSTPAYVNQTKTQPIVPSTFSFRTFFNVPVYDSGNSALVGANLRLKISRGTGSWTFLVTNNLF